MAKKAGKKLYTQKDMENFGHMIAQAVSEAMHMELNAPPEQQGQFHPALDASLSGPPPGQAPEDQAAGPDLMSLLQGATANLSQPEQQLPPEGYDGQAPAVQ